MFSASSALIEGLLRMISGLKGCFESRRGCLRDRPLVYWLLELLLRLSPSGEAANAAELDTRRSKWR